MLMPGLVMLGSRAASWVGRGKVLAARRRRRPAVSAATAFVPAAYPPGLDVGHLLEAARQQFLRLQEAWDAGDMETLGALTTPQMLDDLCTSLCGLAAPASRTDVLSLQASLLGFDDMGPVWLATIEFTGLLREAADADAVPFRELWLLTRDRHPPGDDTAISPAWRLARQQALL